MAQVTEQYYKRDLWAKENLNYVEPHFRLEKAARLVDRLSRGQECLFLDVGCGPAAIKPLLADNVNYHGIDIAIHSQEPYLIQEDFLVNPIGFNSQMFDIVLAQGVFEYVGRFQSQKFSEIRSILKKDGKFVVSYVNFSHIDRHIYNLYNNVQSFGEFHADLSRHFKVERFFPTSHHWHHWEPTGRVMKTIHMHINMTVPLISRLFAIEYFFICSPRESGR